MTTFTVIDKHALSGRPSICIVRGRVAPSGWTISTGDWLTCDWVSTRVVGLELCDVKEPNTFSLILSREVFELVPLGTTLHAFE